MCDWNRTLFEDEYEIEFFRGLAQRAAKNFFAGLELARLLRLWRAKKRCEAMYRHITGTSAVIQKETLEGILDIMNRAVIGGLATEVLDKYLLSYAAEAKHRLDQRLLRPLRVLRERYAVLLGIISSGCDVAIMQTLTVGGCPFDFVKANQFRRNGSRVEVFKLEVYDNKKELLQAALAERGIEPSATMYIGDDWQDVECLSFVRFPVVSFLAHPETRISLKREVNAYAPDSEEAFTRYLERVLS